MEKVPSFISSVGKALRRDVQGKSDSVARRGGNKGVSKRWRSFLESTIASFTMENHGKDSQGVTTVGKQIYDDTQLGNQEAIL